LINGLVGGQLVSSLLAVCTVTVAFCSNLLMVQDKISGARRDLDMTPARPSTLALGYFVASAIATVIISVTALAAGLIYLAFTGWYLSLADVLLIFLDVILLVLFGTALSSIINCNLSTNGQGSAVGTIISSCYGFICGAYMPISSFGTGLQNAVIFLPGTHGTSLLRNHALGGVFEKMEVSGIPEGVTETMATVVDCNLSIGDYTFTEPVMYLILGGATLLLICAYVLINFLRRKSK
jgi:multidrug/hemolysin transport system permease protein